MAKDNLHHYIYRITNLVTGEYYVGMRSSDFPWYEDKYMGSGKILKRAIKKYGIESFVKVPMCFAESREELSILEKGFVNEDTLKDETSYNLKIGGEGGCKPGPRAKGRKLSESHRAALSKSMKGKRNFLGVKHSEKSKMKMHKSHWARDPVKRENVRQKMSETRKNLNIRKCEENNNTLVVQP